MTIPNASTAHPLGEAAGSVPKYEIKTVKDFLKVPPERMEECLTEFRDFLDMARTTTEACKVLGQLIGSEPPETFVQAFIWRDDGERKGTLRLTVEQNEKDKP